VAPSCASERSGLEAPAHGATQANTECHAGCDDVEIPRRPGARRTVGGRDGAIFEDTGLKEKLRQCVSRTKPEFKGQVGQESNLHPAGVEIADATQDPSDLGIPLRYGDGAALTADDAKRVRPMGA
jgi:hypothetical protein